MENKQLDFLDILNILSFCIGLKNLEENINQGDKQDLLSELNEKSKLILEEIHKHLEEQDAKLAIIMEGLKNA